MTNYHVRPIRAAEWREVRALRLAALQDPAARIAFLDTYHEALARPESFWQERARGSSADTVEPGTTPARQWVAIAQDGTWVGTTVALIERKDSEGAIGAVTHDGGHLVGVYIRPEHRGAGLLARLFEAAVQWLTNQGLTRVRLFVHTDNLRAQAAYRRLGFSATGVTAVTAAGVEEEMVLQR